MSQSYFDTSGVNSANSPIGIMSLPHPTVSAYAHMKIQYYTYQKITWGVITRAVPACYYQNRNGVGV